jgi:Fe-S-cluster-containing dehydrogenase component
MSEHCFAGFIRRIARKRKAMDRFALIIDHESCWGCKACEVACKQENRAPAGIKLIRVSEDGPRVVGDRLDFIYRVNSCHHCDEPECVEACPEEAIEKRDDGIVILNEEACIGCGLCIDACPYHAISLDSDRRIARKCNLCSHRIDSGLVPACADNVCLAHCIHFGRPDEIEEVSPRRGVREKV